MLVHGTADAHLEGRFGVEALDSLVGGHGAHPHRGVLPTSRKRDSRSSRCEDNCSVDGADKAGRELHGSMSRQRAEESRPLGDDLVHRCVAANHYIPPFSRRCRERTRAEITKLCEKENAATHLWHSSRTTS